MQTLVLFGWSRPLSELLSTVVVPCLDFGIWCLGKCFCWKIFREPFSGIRVLDIEVVNRVLYERYMLLGPQEDLY